MNDPYIVFGLTKTASAGKLQEAFKDLTQTLEATLHLAGAADAVQAEKALESCRKAMAAITGGGSFDCHKKSLDGLSARLRIGQLCLATHLISLEQLQEAVEVQARSEKQLGEILQDLNFISQQELDGLLIGQDLIVGDEEVKDPQALRLLAMDLITEELAVIGLLEGRLTGETFIKVLNRRGWLSKDLTTAIFGADY
ncbi:MAG: hypothetical protein KGS72_13870 [Cyanobacteria bacterium REEB67]|nr:hypothetical protein [Cyanobacteria bacterium REEB67]